jgi:hypothetical protein
MTKDKALELFVRKYFKLLKSKNDFKKKEYNNLKRSFFGEDLKYKFQNPKDREIADILIKMIIKAHSIQDLETLSDFIDTTPFLKYCNIEAEKYTADLEKITETHRIKEELSGLKEYEKIEHLKQKAVEEAAVSIVEEIRLKKEEYRKLPSILEDVEFEEPENIHTEDETIEWWQQLNLKENPFPGALEGLSLLDKSLFDEIIVTTQPIKWALQKLSSGRYDFFNQALLLGGDFGSGKTTFFDFISIHLLKHHIEPLRIAIMDQISEAHYVQKFEKELCREISRVASTYGIPYQAKLIAADEMVYLMLEIQSRGAKGFLLFIDDLHKNSNREKVFNFLAQLQIFKNNLRREQVHMCYIVSGFPGWRDRIRQDSALSGFFDAPDELLLPDVTPQIAAEAITKRLKAFANNIEKDLSVREEFLHLVFKRESTEIGRPNIGFRPYIKAAVKNFEEGKFDILSVDYSKLDDDIASKIKEYLEEDYDFKEKIHRLVYGGGIKKKETRERTLKLLCEVYLRRGIQEDEDILLSNKFAFKRLMEVGLIQKARREGQLIWVISNELRKLNLEVIRQFNLSLEDYIVPIYIGTSFIKQKKIVNTKSQSEVFKQDLDSWRMQIDSYTYSELQGVIDTYTQNLEPFLDIEMNKTISKSKADARKIKKTIVRLMKALVRYESPVLVDLPPKNHSFDWALRHRTLEYISHFIQLEREFNYENPSKEDLARFITFANESFDEVWRELRKTIEFYNSSRVKPFELPRSILNDIYKNYDNYFIVGPEYFNAIKEFVEIVERILRSYLHISSMLCFGPLENRLKLYPEEIKKYMMRNIPSGTTGSEICNEFQNLNRGQYRLLFTQSKTSGFYRSIIQPVTRSWDTNDLDVFFTLFGDINIIISHLKLISAEEKTKDIPTFFRLACRFVSNICDNLRDLITKNNVCFSEGTTGYVVFGAQIIKDREVVRVASIEDATEIKGIFHWHEVNLGKEFSECSDLFSHSDNSFGDLVFDLLDLENMRIRFSEQFTKTISALTYLEGIGKFKIYTIYGSELCYRNI